MRSHLISQVVLRRFANKSGIVVEHEKKSGTTMPNKTVDIAYTEIDRQIIAESEKQWDNKIENHAEKALNTLVNGNVLNVEKHIQILKKLMALHFVRSFALLQLMEIAKMRYSQQIIDRVIKVYPEHRETIIKKVLSLWPDMVDESLPKIISQNIAKIDMFMEQHGIEVGLAHPRAKFIIGDIPAISINNMGQMGVPITEADNFAMPLTPCHIVALKTSPKSNRYIQLTVKQVKAANNKQIIRALEVYYSTPQGDENE